MRRSTVLLLAVAAILTIGADECPPPPDNIINVETTEPGIVEDGLCSLAEAIENANTGSLPNPDCERGDESLRNRIVLGTELTYTLTEPYREEYGLPEITGWVVIDGRRSIIERAEGAPEFGILRGSHRFELENVTIRNAAGAPGISAYSSLLVHYSKVIGCDIGIDIYGLGPLEVIGSTVRGNRTGIVNTCGWPNIERIDIDIESTTVTGNRPGGGVVYVGCTGDSTLTVTNSTFSSNAAPRGGAVSVVDGDLWMEHCTIVNNTGYTEGGGVFSLRSDVGFSRSIVAQNEGLNCSISENSTMTSAGHNITDDDWCGFDSSSDVRVTDPMLSELDFWGGPTLTIMPLDGSPAIDMAGPYCERLDQRGYLRPADGDGDEVAECDCGAVEVGAIPPIHDQRVPFDPGPPPSSG